MANAFTVAALTPAELVAALAAVLGVAPADVDVADANGDQEGRHWDSPVLCTYEVPDGGDLRLMLDVYVAEEQAGALTESDAARRLAAWTGSTILWPAAEPYPSAYWAVTPVGAATRARVTASDGDEMRFTVDAVEATVPDLPHARVQLLPEILRLHPVSTPASHVFLAPLPPADPGSEQDQIRVALSWWERLARRMEDGWPPSGRYSAEMYEEDLAMRDLLEELAPGIPSRFQAGFLRALRDVDAVYEAHTLPCPDETGDGGWWRRRRPQLITLED